MNIGFGWIIAIGCTIGGFLWLGGHAGQVWVPAEFLIIFGAAVGTLVASNKWRNLKSLFRAFFRIFLPSNLSNAFQVMGYWPNLLYPAPTNIVTNE